MGVAALMLHHPVQARQPFIDGDCVLFLGDSITQDGRYVDLVNAYLWATYPDLHVTIINAGLSSETVSGITEPIHPFPRPNVQDRLDRTLDIAKPDWVLVCYGMNDGIYHPVDQRITDAYKQGMERLLASIHASGAKAILLTPPVFDAQSPAVINALKEAKADDPYGYLKPYEKYDDTLVTLSNIVRTLEQDSRVDRIIDLHASMDDFLKTSKQADVNFVYGDGVHPPLPGHVAMATTVLFGLGEPHDRIETVLARITGLLPPDRSVDELPIAEGAEETRNLIFARGGGMSAAFRKAIQPQTPASHIDRVLNTALIIGDSQENVIKHRIAEAMSDVPEAASPVPKVGNNQ